MVAQIDYQQYEDETEFYHNRMLNEEANQQQTHVVDGVTYPVDPTDITTLSANQERILTILPIIPSLLSVIGSLTIISMVISSYQRKRSSITPYKRLLFGMSCCDVLWSITIPSWAFLLPKATSQRVWAFGNDTTCSAIGTIAQWGFSGICYNGMLTIYFLLTVRFGYKDEDMTRKRICLCGCSSPESLMHMLSIGYPLVTAITGAIMGVYVESSLGLNCWINDYPRNCGDDLEYGETGESCLGSLIAYIFGGLVIFPTMIMVIINNISIFLYVRNTINVGRRRSSMTSIEMSAIGRTSNGFRSRRRASASATISDSQRKRIQAVATQGFLYVAAFLTSYIWTLIIKIMEGASYDADDEASIFWLLCLQSIFMPLQGFFNLIIYVRPNYIRVRRDYPHESKLWAIRRSLYGDSVEPTQQSSLNSQRGGSRDSGNSAPGHNVSSTRRRIVLTTTNTNTNTEHSETGNNNGNVCIDDSFNGNVDEHRTDSNGEGGPSASSLPVVTSQSKKTAMSRPTKHIPGEGGGGGGDTGGIADPNQANIQRQQEHKNDGEQSSKKSSSTRLFPWSTRGDKLATSDDNNSKTNDVVDVTARSSTYNIHHRPEEDYLTGEEPLCSRFDSTVEDDGDNEDEF